MIEVASRLAAILLATTFMAAGAAKLFRYPRWRSAVNEYRLPAWLEGSAAVGVPVAEVTVAIVLVMFSRAVGAASSLVLLALFSAAIARVAIRAGRRVPCGCFGGDRSRDYRWLLGRNALLSVAAAVLLLEGNEDPLVASVSGSDVVPLVLVTAGIALLILLGSQMAGSLRGRVR